METSKFKKQASARAQSGQAMLLAILGLGIFLIGAMAFAIDMGHLWFRRQAAQTAADAACTAGAMDLLVDATDGKTNQGHFTAGSTPSAFDCNATAPNSNTPGNTNPAPCVYAALNGFASTVANGSTALGNNVNVDFPGTVPGVTAPPTSIAPTAFMRVTITDNTPTFFAGMLKGLSKQSIRAISVCGVTEAAAPIPILVLDPQSPKSTPPQSALNIQGNGAITIFGGPNRSIQDNSADSAASCGQSNCSVNSPWGSATIDLSHAGPLGNGADIALSGAPTAQMAGFIPGTAGHWIAPAAPIADPFAQVCYPGQTTNCTTTINGNPAPSVPGAPTPPPDEGIARFPTSPCLSIPCSVGYKDHGCPNPAVVRGDGNCLLYTSGNYSGISISGGGGKIALFDPGLYYMNGDLNLGSLSTVRPGTGTGDGSGGVTFYFVGTHTVSVAANSGSVTYDNFNTLNGPVDSTGTKYPSDATHTNVTYGIGVKCVSSSVVPGNLQGGGAGVNINGNILMGPCTGYYGDPLGTNEPATIGEQRWFLFFQDRSGKGVLPQWGGGGQFLLAGTMYFHSCNASGSGVACTPPPFPPTNSSYFQDIFSLSGNSGAGTFVLGEIVADNLTLGGTSGINMDLNPTNAFNILKASLYQ